MCGGFLRVVEYKNHGSLFRARSEGRCCGYRVGSLGMNSNFPD